MAIVYNCTSCGLLFQLGLTYYLSRKHRQRWGGDTIYLVCDGCGTEYVECLYPRPPHITLRANDSPKSHQITEAESAYCKAQKEQRNIQQEFENRPFSARQMVAGIVVGAGLGILTIPIRLPIYLLRREVLAMIGHWPIEEYDHWQVVYQGDEPLLEVGLKCHYCGKIGGIRRDLTVYRSHGIGLPMEPIGENCPRCGKDSLCVIDDYIFILRNGRRFNSLFMTGLWSI